MAISMKAFYKSRTPTTPEERERAMDEPMARMKQRPECREPLPDSICPESPKRASDCQRDDGEPPEPDIASTNDLSESKNGVPAAAFKGDLLDAASVQEMFGLKPSKLAEDVAVYRAFVVCIGGVDRFPAFLFTGEVRRKDIARVVRKLRDLDGWSIWHFFTSRRGSLGRVTPLTALARGGR